MGFTEILTLILLVLKAFGVINVSWLMVFMPMIVVYGMLVAIVMVGGLIGMREMRK